MLEEFCQWAAKHYEFVSLTEGSKRIHDTSLRRPMISVTYDDGDHSVFETAMPIHQKLGIPATVFVCPDWASRGKAFHDNEKTRESMTWAQLRAWEESGLNVGGHTMNHIPLTMSSLARAQWEILECTRRIEEELGCAVRSFAYPWGLYTTEITRWLEESKLFDAVLTCEEKDTYPSHTGIHFGRRPFEFTQDRRSKQFRPQPLVTLLRRCLYQRIQAQVAPKTFTMDRFKSE